jgi:hypothetical protein
MTSTLLSTLAMLSASVRIFDMPSMPLRRYVKFCICSGLVESRPRSWLPYHITEKFEASV